MGCFVNESVLCFSYICFFVCLYVHSKAVTYKTGQSGMKMESDVLKVCGPLPIALLCLV